MTHLFTLLLAGAAIAFTLLAAVTVSNALRLRRILLKWHGGQEFAVFFLLAIGAILWVDLRDGSLPATTWAVYAWVAVMWMLSSALMSMRFVTDHGIVKNLNDPDQTVPWYSIHDYIEQETPKGIRFVFMYRSPEVTRLELLVPHARIDAFRKVLLRKFQRRFSEPMFSPTEPEHHP